ncbi:MAG: PAS domain S-box protein [Gemmatimonadetes bacterium]|nr:PAS domain S-box protein [Gemmatimonadota bacterium]
MIRRNTRRFRAEPFQGPAIVMNVCSGGGSEAVGESAPPGVGDAPPGLWGISRHLPGPSCRAPQAGKELVQGVLSADEYRAVFESAPDGIMVVDHDGVVRDLNPAAEAMFGFPREEVLGEAVEMLLPEAFRRAHVAHRERYRRNPHSRPMGVGLELTAQRKDGAEFPAEISLSPWRHDGRDFVICTVRDITERKRSRDFSEGALRSVEEERQRIARELHDDTAQRLATLMVKVRLLSKETDEARRAHGLGELRAQILETAEGVKRIARGLRPPELEEVGLRSALQAYARGLWEAAGFEVDVDMEPVEHLLDAESKLCLYRIVQESLSNALRHSGTDRARVAVWVEDERIAALVEDTGRGFRAAQVSADGGGLGLLGMQERAVMLGGRVLVDSTPGEGTRVRIELPTSPVEVRHA